MRTCMTLGYLEAFDTESSFSKTGGLAAGIYVVASYPKSVASRQGASNGLSFISI